MPLLDIVSIFTYDKGGIIYSTDDFFMRDGIYVFDGKAISNAHQWNQQRTETALQQGKIYINYSFLRYYPSILYLYVYLSNLYPSIQSIRLSVYSSMRLSVYHVYLILYFILIICSKGVSPIIVDNTNTQKWEAKFYVEKAIEYGYEIVIRYVLSVLDKRNRIYLVLGSNNYVFI